MAHRLRNEGMTCWAEALRLAWSMWRSERTNSVERITFVKVEDNTTRSAWVRRFTAPVRGVVKFIELTANGAEQWRSFRVDNFNM